MSKLTSITLETHSKIFFPLPTPGVLLQFCNDIKNNVENDVIYVVIKISRKVVFL